MKNPQAEAAAIQAKSQADLAEMLSVESLPMFAKMFGAVEGQLSGGPDQIAPFIKDAFDRARTGHNESYAQALRTGSELTRYRALTANNPYTQGEVTSHLQQFGYGLEQERQQGLKTLNFQEAQTGLQGYNALMNTLSGGIGGTLQLGGGFNNMTNQAISGLPTSTTGQNIASGVVSGAAAGAMTGNPYAIAIGAILGGVGGAMRTG